MLAPIPCIMVKNPKAGPICSTPTRSVVSMDKRKAKTPEIKTKALLIYLLISCLKLPH